MVLKNTELNETEAHRNKNRKQMRNPKKNGNRSKFQHRSGETSIQKSGDRHNIGWGRRRPVKTLIGMQKSHIIKMIRNPEHSEGTHKRKGRIDHV